MCPNPEEFDELFYSSSSRIVLLTRLVSGLLILMSFSGPFNLAPGGFLAAPSLISNCLMELREGHGGWRPAYREWGTKTLPCPEAPRGPPQFPFWSPYKTFSMYHLITVL